MKIIGEKTKAVNAIVNAISAFRFNYDKVGMKGSYHNDPIGINTLHARFTGLSVTRCIIADFPSAWILN